MNLKKMGGHPLIDSKPTTTRTRDKPQPSFLFGIDDSSSEDESEANHIEDLDDAESHSDESAKIDKNDETVSNKIDEFYQRYLKTKYVYIHKKVKSRKRKFRGNYKDKKSIRTQKIRRKIISKIWNSIKWHDESSEELQIAVKEILEGVQDRVGDYYAVEVAKILEEYQESIGKHKFDIGCIPDVEYKIKLLDGVKPKTVKCKPKPWEHEQEIKKTVETLLKYGIISPYHGPWGSEAFVVYNGDGSTRMVCNYKWLNAHSEGDSYPTSSVPDMLNKFGGKTIYSSFDINKAFFNVRVAEESKKYTAFVTKYGTFVWNVMPFGGKACPATWARASDIVFKHCIDLIKYVDDLIIASKAENGKSDLQNHLIGIRSFFACCKKYNIKVKLSKCEFFVKEVKFLGNIITPKGRRVDDGYVKKLLEFAHPESKMELRAYLGAIEWISKHVYGFRKLMQPLRPLLKTCNPWKWNQKHQEAFNSIQNIIQNSELLHHPDLNDEFYIFCDASKYHYGSILLQKREGKYVIIDMFSRSWTGSTLKKHITTKELLAVVESVKTWKKYLYTNTFYIHSDSRNLAHLFKRTEAGRTNNKAHYDWVMLLSQYSFEVRFIKGIHNVIADYLSRYIKHPEKLKIWKEGSRPLAEYNEHKRMKFHFDKKKKKKSRPHPKHVFALRRRQSELFIDGVLPFDNDCDREVAMCSIKSSEHYVHFQKDRDFVKWNKVMPDYLDTGGILNGFAKQHQLQQQIKIEQIEYVFTNRYPRRKKRRVDYSRERISVNPETVKNLYPEVRVSTHNIDDNERIDCPTRNQRRILDQTENGQLAGIAEDELEFEQRNEINIRGYPDADEPVLYGENYEIPYRVYAEELLKDPEIETLELFNVDKIRQNQEEFVLYKIIRNYLKGVDTRDDIKTIPTRIRNEVVKHNRYSMHDGLLMYSKAVNEHRICLAPEHQKAAMQWLHRNLMYGAHCDANSMIANIKTKFYWPGYDDDVRMYVKECPACQKAKGYPDNKVGHIKLFNPKYPNESVAIDHVGILPETADGARYITTYYDRYSGYTKSVCVKSIDSFTTATNFLKHWISVFGPPKEILTDLGWDFRSELFQHLTGQICGIQHKSTTAYHASCNGAVERFNRTLKTALRTISVDKELDFANGDSYDLFISHINSVHNNRASRRTNYKLCPNELMIGRKVETPMDFKLNENVKFKNRALKDKYEGYVANMIKINKAIAEKELKAYHDAREQYANRGRKEPEFKLKQLVFYWIGPYPPFGSQKLKIHWQGPYRIIQIWNNGNNYTLQSVKYPKIFVNANVKRIKAFNDGVDQRYKVHAPDVPEEELKEMDAIAKEFNDEL